ncbi:MAG: VanZ family protein [Pseudomonadota bacterium]
MAASLPIPAASASVFARISLLIYTLLIVYASWYPFIGWHDNGLGPSAYLLAPFPHYRTMFDLVTNVVAYIPLGILLVFSLYPRIQRWWAIVVAIIAGALVSGTMEAVQTFLPRRVPSNLDLITNISGVMLGALAGVLLTRTFLEQSRFLLLRRRWFSHDASRGLIVLALWPLAQIYPQGYLFGHGQIMPILSNWLSVWLTTPIDLSALLLHESALTIEQYLLSETIITACGLTGALLTLLCLSRDKAPKLVLGFSLVAAAVIMKALSSALLFSPENAFVWLTPGAQGGVLIGAMMLSGLAFAPPVAQRRVAALALIVSLVVVNASPANPYFISTLQDWVQGKFLNFNGAAQFLSLLWPFLTLWFLYHPLHRLKQK